MRTLHLGFGLLFFLLFLASGWHMRQLLPPFTGELDFQRMIYRASHLYLLLTSLLNIAVGSYWQKRATIIGRLLQNGGSMLLLASPLLLALAFLLEPTTPMHLRPFTLAGCWSALIGVMLGLLSSLIPRPR